MTHPVHSACTRRKFLAGGSALWLCAADLPAKETISGNPVLLWNDAFLQWVRAQTPPPSLTARNLALLHLALWRTTAATQRGNALPAALTTTGQEICLTLFPSRQAEIAALAGRAESAAGEDRSVLETGRRIAREVMELRAADGSSTTIHYVPKDAPGQWRRTPPAMRPPELPHWGKVTPFLLKSPDQFRPPPPPDISGDVFAKDLAEVRDLGGKDSPKRTAEETQTANFWSDFSYTTSPPGHWNDIARELAAARRLSVSETARLFAMLNLAMADAGIAAWDCKYRYNYWRPVTALNPGPDAKWESLLATPPHPDYVSGHSSFSGAATAVLEAFFGIDKLTFSATSDTVKGVTRRYASLKACAGEISRSRVLAGIHFPSACREGLILGRKIGEWSVRAFDKIR